MKLVSSDFTNYGSIPSRYICDGENISPPLQWEKVPKETKFSIFVCDDPDAPKGTWNHWIIFNLLARTNFLPEGKNQFSPKTKLGKNSWAKENYDGPYPPDKKHYYFFKLYALDAFLELPSGITKQQIQWAIKEQVIEKTELVEVYAQPWQKE